MKIYTRTGDTGLTSLHGGKRVPKDDIRVDAYGSVDETNSFLGAALAEKPDISIANVLRKIQADLFETGTDLANPSQDIKSKSPNAAWRIVPDHVTALEKFIDEFETVLDPLHSFILPGGSKVSAFLHIARTSCRRAERRVVQLKCKEEVNEEVIRYLNRLSDLLFVMARLGNKHAGIDEPTWP